MSQTRATALFRCETRSCSETRREAQELRKRPWLEPQQDFEGLGLQDLAFKPEKLPWLEPQQHFEKMASEIDRKSENEKGDQSLRL